MSDPFDREALLAKVVAGKSLASANLSGANLSGANLSFANLRSANLRIANLSDADLRRANLSGANLSGADLSDADLSFANLRSADLRSADLSFANLRSANLRSADLSDADLRSANLSGANLRSADLRSAVLPTGETWEQYLKQVVPALCTAGGASLTDVAQHFNCHSWANCPMAVAFGAHRLQDVPILLRPRVEQFVHLFDNCLIAVAKIDGSITFTSASASRSRQFSASRPPLPH